MEIKTVKLPKGLRVLAKETQYGLTPITYTNFKQADKKIMELEQLGFNVTIWGLGKPAKYIVFIEN